MNSRLKDLKCIKKLSYIIFILILVLSLVGCSNYKFTGNTNQSSETYIENEDYQNYLNLYSNFAKTSDGYYFISDNRLYFFDKQSHNVTIVCNKINCKHNDDRCTAYFSNFSFFPIQLSYYNNALYLLGWETDGSNIHNNYIYQISTENFKRKKAVYIGSSNGLTSTVFLIHRGYVYYTTNSNTMKKTSAILYRKQLGNTDKTDTGKIAFEHTGIGAQIQDISAYANNIYISFASYENEKGDGYKTSFSSINIHTLQEKCILDSSIFAAYADSNYVYYENDENTVNCVDTNTNEETFFCNIKGPCYISADSNYVYFDNLQSIYIDKIDEKDRKILVYDKSGKYVTEITPKNPKDDCYFGGDDMMIFKEIIADEVTEADGAKGYYVLDKSQFKSPDKQFIDME